MPRGPRVKGPAGAEEKIHPEGLLGMSEPKSAEKLSGIDGDFLGGQL